MALPSTGTDESMLGRRFGRRVVTARADDGRDRWAVRCDCGNEGVARGSHLRGGKSDSCGCLKIERARAARMTHGATVNHGKAPEYDVWSGMLQRCTNPRDDAYANYGGRGITVCDRWRNDFAAFLEDMGPRPSPQHSIDRRDNDGNYEPGNCRWATRMEQASNRRNSLRIPVGAETLTAAQWEARAGLKPGTVSHRLINGWLPVDAVSTPNGARRRRPQAEART
jgi:hypothetical protein